MSDISFSFPRGKAVACGGRDAVHVRRAVHRFVLISELQQCPEKEKIQTIENEDYVLIICVELLYSYIYDINK